MKKRNMNGNKRPFLGAKRKWGTRLKRFNSPLGFLLFLFVLSLSFSYGQQTITGTLTATDAVNSNELVTKSQLDAVAASSTDDQTLSLTGNTLTLENGGTVDLTSYLDNTDGQTITDFSLSGNILSLTLSGGNTQTVDLSSIAGGGGVSSKTFSPVIEVTQDTTITSTAFANSKNFFWTDSATDIKVTVTGAGISPGEYATFSQEGEGSFQFEGDVVYGFQTIDSTSIVNVIKKGTGIKPNGSWEDYLSATPHPNATNPNSELITGDASAFVSNANSAVEEPTGFHSPVGATVSSVADSSNNYVDYVLRITADTNGTLKRNRFDLDHISWENGEIYEVYILNRQNNTNDSFRYRLSLGTTSGDHNTFVSAHTDWQLESFEFTSDGTILRLEAWARNSALAGEYSDVLVSIKKKDD